MLRPDPGDQPGKKFFQDFFIAQAGIPGAEKKVVRLRRKRNRHERLADLPGKDFSEERHVIGIILLIQGSNWQQEACNGVSDMINIAAAYHGRVAPVRVQSPFDFREIPLVHDSGPSFHVV